MTRRVSFRLPGQNGFQVLVPELFQKNSCQSEIQKAQMSSAVFVFSN
jgi:hypothetical protein